jgi:ABC-type glutathione transport system ATPase component
VARPSGTLVSASPFGLAGPSPSRQPGREPLVAIWVRALAKRYGTLEAVRGIDLDVRVGEILGLIGPDGAEKTSTFQILGGVMEATSGTAELLGQPPRDARASVGYLTQAFSLYQDLRRGRESPLRGRAPARAARPDRGAGA